jgi:hypothetical protein
VLAQAKNPGGVLLATYAQVPGKRKRMAVAQVRLLVELANTERAGVE